MDLRIFMEWDEQCGISLSNMYPFREGIEEQINVRNYGSDIKTISIVLICRARDLKQRKRFKRDLHCFEYDIILDYFLIKNLATSEKKEAIQKQVVENTVHIFSKYKFKDFDKDRFIRELESIVNSITW